MGQPDHHGTDAGVLRFASWNGWNYWQQRQAAQAAVLFDTFENASKQGDLTLLARSLSDLQDQFPRATLTAQASLLAAKTSFDKEQPTDAEKPLTWVVDHASDEAYVALARLRLSALAIQRKDMAKARSWVEGKTPPTGFQTLFDDRLGDIALIEGKHDEAKCRFHQRLQSHGRVFRVSSLNRGQTQHLGRGCGFS
jgi:predicted negative regulator of RcsB-dependent stress response